MSLAFRSTCPPEPLAKLSEPATSTMRLVGAAGAATVTNPAVPTLIAESVTGLMALPELGPNAVLPLEFKVAWDESEPMTSVMRLAGATVADVLATEPPMAIESVPVLTLVGPV